MAGEQSSECSSLSQWSFISQGDSTRCFLEGSFLKSSDGGFVMAGKLEVGSRVCADDETELRVRAATPYHHRSVELVKFQTERAFLIVTGNHRMVCPGDEIKLARELERGDYVRCSEGVDRLLNVEHFDSEVTVISIVFCPDRPVAAYHLPEHAILSMGEKMARRTRRGGMNRRGSDWLAHPGDDQLSIPATHDSYL